MAEEFVLLVFFFGFGFSFDLNWFGLIWCLCCVLRVYKLAGRLLHPFICLFIWHVWICIAFISMCRHAGCIIYRPLNVYLSLCCIICFDSGLSILLSHCITSVLKGADGLPFLLYPYSIKEHNVTLWCAFVFIWDVYFIRQCIRATLRKKEKVINLETGSFLHILFKVLILMTVWCWCCQKIKYLLVCETYTEVQFHEMLHSPHSNNSPPLKQWVTIFMTIILEVCDFFIFISSMALIFRHFIYSLIVCGKL